MIRATVVCDASFHKGRNASYGIGGWAAWVAVDGFPDRIKGSGSIRASTMTNSTEAEVYAALNGIWLARRYGAELILVRSDCSTVADLINGRVKSERLLSIWNEALDHPDMAGVRLMAHHVKGHGPIQCAATYVNDWCDRQAKAAMRKQRKELRLERRPEGNRQSG